MIGAVGAVGWWVRTEGGEGDMASGDEASGVSGVSGVIGVTGASGER